MRSPRKRHANRGLRKRCGCARSKWNTCDHPWHFNLTLKGGGPSIRKNLDELAGRRIRGKEEAETAVEDLRSAFRKGDLVATTVPMLDAAGAPVLTASGKPRYRVEISEARLPVRQVLTLAQLLAAYVKEYVTAERPRGLINVRYQVGAICGAVLDLPTGERLAFGQWHVCDIGTGALEKFRATRRTQAIVTATDQDGQERARRKGGVPTTNRDLSLLRAAFNWAIRLGYVETTPFKKSTETVVKLSRETSRRWRLEGDEGERLLKACDPILLNPRTKLPQLVQPRPRLRPIVEAAIETGCRRGELLSLQWWQVKDLDGVNRRLDLPASKTKTTRDRVVPISTRLKAILEMRRKDPAGEDLPPDAYVFGNELGQRTNSIKTAWKLTCRRAGIEGLHFHDLRREAGSRWIDGGVPLQTVREWLGHTNIAQTDTYLDSTVRGQHEAMRRFEEMQAREVLRQQGLEEARVQASATDVEKQPQSDGARTTEEPVN